jgi:hypothetical protein
LPAILRWACQLRSARGVQAAALRTLIKKLDTAQNAQITALEDIPDGPAAAPCAPASDQTLRALPAILNPSQDGYHDTNPGPPALGT